MACHSTTRNGPDSLLDLTKYLDIESLARGSPAHRRLTQKGLGELWLVYHSPNVVAILSIGTLNKDSQLPVIRHTLQVSAL